MHFREIRHISLPCMLCISRKTSIADPSLGLHFRAANVYDRPYVYSGENFSLFLDPPSEILLFAKNAVAGIINVFPLIFGFGCSGLPVV